MLQWYEEFFKYFFSHEELATYFSSAAAKLPSFSALLTSAVERNTTPLRPTRPHDGPWATRHFVMLSSLLSDPMESARPRQVNGPVMAHTYIGRSTTRSSPVTWYPECSCIISAHSFNGFPQHLPKNSYGRQNSPLQTVTTVNCSPLVSSAHHSMLCTVRYWNHVTSSRLHQQN